MTLCVHVPSKQRLPRCHQATEKTHLSLFGMERVPGSRRVPRRFI